MKKVYPAVLLLGSLLLAGCMKASSIQLAIAPDQTPETNRPVTIDVDVSPGFIKIDPNSITISGGESWVEDGVIKFQTDKPGDYTMKVTQNNVESNVLIIPVAKADHFRNPASSTVSSSTSSSEAKSFQSSTLTSASSESRSHEELLKDAAKTVQEEKMSVDEVYQKQDALVSDQTPVTINGQLPQTAISDKAGNPVMVLWNDQVSEYIILDGFEIPFGGCPAQVSGTLSRNANGELVLNMTYITTDAVPAVGQGSQNAEASAQSAAASKEQAESSALPSPEE